MISLNIGEEKNGKFDVHETLMVNKNLLTEEFHLEQIKEMESFLNSRWYNKGLLLLGIRSDDHFERGYSKILVDLHRQVKNKIARVICTIAPRAEYDAYIAQQQSKQLQKQEQELEKHGLSR